MSPDFDAKQWHFVEELRNIAENVRRCGKSAVPTAVQRLWEIGAVPDIHVTEDHGRAPALLPWERVEWYAGQLLLFLQYETEAFVAVFLTRLNLYVPRLPEVEISPTDLVLSWKQQQFVSELRHIVYDLDAAEEWPSSAGDARDALRRLGVEPCEDGNPAPTAVSHLRTRWYAGRLLYLLDRGRYMDAGHYIDALDKYVPKLPEQREGQIVFPEKVVLAPREQIEEGLAAIEPLEGASIVALAEYMNLVHRGSLAARKLLVLAQTESEREVLGEDAAILSARFDRTVQRMAARASA